MSLSGDTRRPARRRPMADINVVPYIDVTLVLLIIFMITAPMLETGVDVELPQAEAKTLNPDEQLPIIITINADGALFLDAGNQADAPVTDAELVSRVQAALEKKPGLAVLIRGDRKVDYGRVVTVMAGLKQAGLPSVGLMTQPAIE
jgi:biopolymer transport protein TolR